MNQQNYHQTIIIGNATFKNIPEKIKENIQNNEQIKSTLMNKEWNISKLQIDSFLDQENYLKYNWQKTFLYMSQCLAQRIYLCDNKRVQIISQIQYTKFVNLRLIDLSYNEISNIQSLSSINFQCLQKLYLSYNKISQIKSLNRLSTPFLLAISFSLNPLKEINALIRSKINQKQIEQLALQNSQSSISITQDLSVIVKLNCEKTKRFCINKQCRIRQEKVQSMLKLRFPVIKF